MPTDEDRCVRCTHLRRVHTAHGGCAACEDAIGCPGFEAYKAGSERPLILAAMKRIDAEQHREGVHYCLGCGHRAISHRMLTGGGGCQVRDCPCQLSRNYVDIHQPATQEPEEILAQDICPNDHIAFTKFTGSLVPTRVEGLASITLTAGGDDWTYVQMLGLHEFISLPRTMVVQRFPKAES